MYLVRTPNFLRTLFPGFLWKFDPQQKDIYLTFDDGPIPEVTPWVLDQLKHFNAKATFFCVGENIKKHPEVFTQLVSEGHSIGSHTFNHLNGWYTENKQYFKNVMEGARQAKSKLFRPPYGKIKPSQAYFLNRHYTIVMWDVLSGDFDPEISAERVLDNVTKNSSNGSIVVFHDSKKTFEKLQFVLPKALEFFKRQGYQFKVL